MEESPRKNTSLPMSETSFRFNALKEILKVDRNSWKFSLLTSFVITLISIIYVQSVMASWGVYGFSFDDSWIHVQYARTIFEGKPWQYAWGIPSTGSSRPLWSVILSPIFIFGYDHDAVVTSVLIIAGILYIIEVFLVGEIVRQHTSRWQYITSFGRPIVHFGCKH
jgi:hypothetical protein